jgi:hypothetical protein
LIEDPSERLTLQLLILSLLVFSEIKIETLVVDLLGFIQLKPNDKTGSSAIDGKRFLELNASLI